MKNADMPAMPTKMLDESGRYLLGSGLTKREIFALHAMQGVIAAKSTLGYDSWDLAEMAVQFTDALLAELDK